MPAEADETVSSASAPDGMVLRRVWSSWDLWLAALAMVVAALASGYASDGSTVRLLVTLPILLVAPGYLLLQAAILPRAGRERRWLHLAFSLGVSPAVVGLLALATALVPGAFRPGPIVTTVTIGCLVLASVALARRASFELRAQEGPTVSAT